MMTASLLSGLNAEEIRISKTRIMTDYVRDDAREVVIDTKNNLMWQDDASVGTLEKDWASAKAYCQVLDFAGYSDWRLASIKELESIAEPENHPKAIVNGFKNVAPNHYWSSSVSQSVSEDAWNVYFKYGSSRYNGKASAYRVRCVREAQRSTIFPPFSSHLSYG